ncbi:MAG: hypothetical protein ACSHWU_07595 [Marinicella sp.]
MNHNELFYLVYLSQIAMISIIIPMWIKKRFDNMVLNHPPAIYPKLYPVSIDTMRYAMKTFRILNAMMVFIGLLIIGITLITQSAELLNWDTQAMLTVTFLLQLLPFLYLGLSGIKYQQIMRQVGQPTKRKAQLTPRNLLDFVPKQLLIATFVTFISYAMVVIYIQQNPFPGFAGYWNILYVFLLNIFYIFMIHRILSGRKMDPHQAQEDRLNHTRLIAKILIMGAILCNLFLTISMVLSVLDLRHIGDIIQSLYFQLVALMMSQTSTYEPNNYDVYRADSNMVHTN